MSYDGKAYAECQKEASRKFEKVHWAVRIEGGPAVTGLPEQNPVLTCIGHVPNTQPNRGGHKASSVPRGSLAQELDLVFPFDTWDLSRHMTRVQHVTCPN